MSRTEIDRLLAAAAEAQRGGRARDAAAAFERIVAIAPDHAVALNALAVRALAEGDAARAQGLLQRATAADPRAGALWMNLAKAQRLLGDASGERASLLRALDLDQRDFMALVRLAELHERLGEENEAAQRWVGVAALARSMERRTPELDRLLAHAQAAVARNAAAFGAAVESALADELAALDGRDRRRFTACLDHALGRRAIFPNICEGLHYPFLPADEFFDRAHFPWLADLEAQTAVVRDECAALMAGGAADLVPYVSQAPGTPANKWTPLDNDLGWSARHLWKDGARDAAACAACPATAALLAEVPMADMPGRTPTAFFSVLRPRTRIPPHTGVSNVRAVIHLPLIVPEGCGFRVGGETRAWREGEAFAFDDTIEHEAWNDSDEPRALLILDVWNPHLSEVECAMLRGFFASADAAGFGPQRTLRVGES